MSKTYKLVLHILGLQREKTWPWNNSDCWVW